MKRTVLIAIPILALSFFAWKFVRAHSAYNEAIESTPPPLETVIDSERLATFLTEVDNGEWGLIGENEGMSELFEITKLPSGIEGYQAFYEFEAPSFSFFNNIENVRNAEIALVRRGLVPLPNDGFFHVSKDMSYGVVFVGDTVAAFCRISGDTTIEGSMLKRVDNPEPGGGGNGS